MGYNWVISDDGVVQAFGGQISFKKAEDADEAYRMIAKDLKAGLSIVYTIRITLGLYTVDTIQHSALRFAKLYVDEETATKDITRIIDFIEGV